MNNIRQVQNLNKRELENAVPPEASWHADYRDTAYIYIGSLPYDLSEGDILTIFSQFGEPVHLNLVRDKDTGKSRGFAFLKYEDQRSTDLAVDNLGGATVMGRMLSVDHVRYKRREEEGLEDNVRPDTIASAAAAAADGERKAVGNGEVDHERDRKRKRRRGIKAEESEDEEKTIRPMLEEEKELESLIRDHDEEDPMKEYLIQEKKEEVAKAVERAEKREKPSSSRRRDENREKSHRHRHRHHHRRRHSDDRSPSKERRTRRHRPRSQSTERRHHRDRRDREK